MDVGKIQTWLRAFARERDWEQFHTPKNLAMALAGEAGELLELFQWLTPDQSQAVMQDGKSAEAVRDELSDVLVYCLRLADILGMSPEDLEQAVWSKLQKNAAKYPAELARGNARKYTDLKP